MPSTNIFWTYYSHPVGGRGDRPFKEAVPVYESVGDAIFALTSIVEAHEARLADAQSHRRYNIGQALGADKIPRWGKTPVFYRGQPSIRHHLLPTMFRTTSDEQATVLEEIAQRTQRLKKSIERLDMLIQRVDELAFLRELSGRQKEALLRHYGCPSFLLDVTTSIDVAAHFASSWAAQGNGQESEKSLELGIIYAFNLIDILNTSGVTMCGAIGHNAGYEYTPIGPTIRDMFCYESPTIAWQEEVAIEFRNADTISLDFTFVPEVKRIETQKAAFISTHSDYFPDRKRDEFSLNKLGTWDILAFLAYKVCFIQTGHMHSAVDGNESIYPTDTLTEWVTNIIQEC